MCEKLTIVLRVANIYHSWESRKCNNNHIIVSSSHDYTRDKKDDCIYNWKNGINSYNWCGKLKWELSSYFLSSKYETGVLNVMKRYYPCFYFYCNINNKVKQCTTKRNRVQWLFPPLLFPRKVCPFLCSEIAIMFAFTPLLFVKSRTGDLTEDALSAATYIN